MMSDRDFHDFIDRCYLELEFKQQALFNKYRISHFDRYGLEGGNHSIDFISNDNVELRFKVVYIGTWSHIQNNWMWGWYNPSLTDEIRKEASALRALQEKTGYKIFNDNGFDCDEEMAAELTGMAVHQLNAQGMYRIPGEKSHLFLALMETI